MVGTEIFLIACVHTGSERTWHPARWVSVSLFSGHYCVYRRGSSCLLVRLDAGWKWTVGFTLRHTHSREKSHGTYWV